MSLDPIAAPRRARPASTPAPPCRTFGPSMLRVLASLFVFAVASGFPGLLSAAPPALPLTSPTQVGLRPEQFKYIDDAVQASLDAGQLPGCVIAVGRHGQLAMLKAYGNREVQPSKVPMTVDTVFDMASITKPVATATSMMVLLERGHVRLRDRVSDHFPEFSAHGKELISVTQLLTHHSGLIADNPIGDYESGRATAWQQILNQQLVEAPGTKFIYSDVGFITLGELVEKVSGQNLHEFSQQHIFGPLGMFETGYLPADELRARAAPTEQRAGEWIRGEVHDPRAFHLGGIAGHAGLFSTARDLAIYAQMMLQEGSYGGVRILSPPTVELMTRAYDVSGSQRGLGWDKLSGYSINRGENFSPRAFGHGGFTGTVLWIDPELDLFVIFLSNRVHPDGTGNVNALAGRIATIVAAAVEPALEPAAQAVSAASGGASVVETGLDVLEQQQFAPLAGQRIGLITNHTGVNRQGVSNIQLLRQAPHVNLVALFSPEHGIAGQQDVAVIQDGADEATGLQVFSLYGESRRPTAVQLAEIDTLVFDIQDIGTRFYTYVSTMGLAMQAAAEHHKRFVVLDRPNPINGMVVDGPVLDAGRESFVGFHSLPIRHGMTIGELARMFATELQLEIDLQVVPLRHWQRSQEFDQTGLLWVNPSPNMRSLNQALLYPGVGLLETTNVSVGRGTDTPFERCGAPWINGPQLADRLNRAGLPGIRFLAVSFVPTSSVYANQACHGVQLLITQRDALNPLDVGFEFARALRELYASQWTFDEYHRLLGDQQVWQAVGEARSLAEIRRLFSPELADFQRRRACFLLY